MLVPFTGNPDAFRASLALATLDRQAWVAFRTSFESRFPGLTIATGDSEGHRGSQGSRQWPLRSSGGVPMAVSGWRKTKGDLRSPRYSMARSCICGQVHSLHIHTPDPARPVSLASFGRLFADIETEVLDALCAPCDLFALTPSSRERIERLWDLLPCPTALVSQGMVALAWNTEMEHALCERRLFRPASRFDLVSPRDDCAKLALGDALHAPSPLSTEGVTIPLGPQPDGPTMIVRPLACPRNASNSDGGTDRLFILTIENGSRPVASLGASVPTGGMGLESTI